MKTILSIFLLIGLCFGQNVDWSDKTINYPDSLDDSTSIMYANPGERVFSSDLNKMLRAIRVIQEKIGVLGSDSVLSRSETVDSINTYTGSTNVVQYGAIANDANEDRTAIQAAINSNYNHVIVGNSLADTFLLDQPLLLKSNSTFEIRGCLKVMDGDSGTLTANADSTDWYFTTDDTANLAVGEYVGVTDTNQNNNYEAWRAWSGRIDSIKTDTVYLDNQAGYYYKTADNARWGHTNNALLLNDLSNVTIKGTGVIHMNRENQMQLHTVRGVGQAEQQRANCGISVWKCTNVFINDITVRNAMMHNIAITGENTGDNNNIRSKGVTTVWPNEKNYLIRFADYVYLEDCAVDSAEWEDGIMFYGNDRYCVVSNVTITNNKRYGLGWNSSTSEHLNAFNIVARNNTSFALFIAAQKANVANVTTNDQIRIHDAYTAHDINLNNINIVGAEDVGEDIFQVLGGVERLTISNLNIRDCEGTAIAIDSSGGDVAHRLKIIGGGISMHEGEDLSMEENFTLDTLSFVFPDTAGVGTSIINLNNNLAAQYSYVDQNIPIENDITVNSIGFYPRYTETGDDDTVYVGVLYRDTALDYNVRNYVKIVGTTTASTYKYFSAPDDFTAFAADSGDVIGVWIPATNGIEIKRSGSNAHSDSLIYKNTVGYNMFTADSVVCDGYIGTDAIGIQLMGDLR